MNIAALVLGIVGLVFSLIPCLGMYALPITLLAVILGAIAMKQPKKGMAIAGLICGSLGTLMAAYWLYAYFAVKDDFHDAVNKFGEGVRKGMEREKEREKARKDELEKGSPTEMVPKHDQPDEPAKPDDTKPAPQ